VRLSQRLEGCEFYRVAASGPSSANSEEISKTAGDVEGAGYLGPVLQIFQALNSESLLIDDESSPPSGLCGSAASGSVRAFWLAIQL